MPVSSPSKVRIIPKGQQSPGSIRNYGNEFRNVKGDNAKLWASVGDMASNIQSQFDKLFLALQSPIPLPDPIQITAPDGSLVASIGHTIDPDTNASYPGIYANYLYVGGNGPATAPLFSNGQMVVVGQNGQVYVLDPYANIGAWLGTQSEASKTVTGAANSGGAIRLTVTAHGYVTGDQINAANVGGVPNATGQWVITVIDANHFDLIGSTWAGAFTSGGTVNRFFAGGAFSTVAIGVAQRITNVADNGSGLVRVTVPSHGYSTGYAVVLTGVEGVPDITGVSWQITVIDANNFDLVGSTFSGTYVQGGLSLNWPTAKFIARDDGSVSITNATIELRDGGKEIVLDPTGPQIVASTNGSTPSVTITPEEVQILADATNLYQVSINSASGTATISTNGDVSLDDRQVFLTGFSGSTANGPLISFRHYRGTGASASATLSGDTLGGNEYEGYDTVGVSASAEILARATEDFSTTAHGSELIFKVTGPGTISLAQAVSIRVSAAGAPRVGIGGTATTYPLEVTGDMNVSGVYRKGGTAGISVTRNMVASVSTSALGVFGTPGAGQSNGSVVTGVTLTSTGFSGGIITS